MSIISRDSPAGVLTRYIGRLTAATERLIDASREPALVASIIVGFVVLWMIFWTVTTAPLDVQIDAGEASVWAQHFAFGYKHPPMTGWIFILWFSVFPRESWASELLAVTNNAIALAVSWRLLRDHLDKNRALLGLVALILVPFYTVKSEVLNANTVMMPFWAATLLFYLRARRSLSVVDALLAGAFASLTMLGKYWAVFLFAGMAAAALTGPHVRRFWRSPAPYAMAVGALIVLDPHLWWTLHHREGVQFAESVVNQLSSAETLWKTGYYLVGAIAYVIAPLIFFAALKPSRTALRDTIWPADEIRRQAVVLLLLPLLLPAVINLVISYRLTPDWTCPNWALLPLVLYGSPELAVDARAATRAGLFGLAIVLAVVAASPAIAYVRLHSAADRERMYTRQVAEQAQSLTDQPIRFVWGTLEIVPGLLFYLPQARALPATDGSGALLIVCSATDAACQSYAASQANSAAGARTITSTFVRSFLGFTGPAETFRITVVPPTQSPARPGKAG